MYFAIGNASVLFLGVVAETPRAKIEVSSRELAIH